MRNYGVLQKKKKKKEIMVFSRYIFVASICGYHMTSLGFTFHGLVMRCMFLFRLSPASHNYEPVSVLFSRCQLIPAVGRRAGGGEGDCDIQSTKPKIYFNVYTLKGHQNNLVKIHSTLCALKENKTKINN